MSKGFEYKFVRLGEGRTSALFGPNGEGRKTYRSVDAAVAAA